MMTTNNAAAHQPLAEIDRLYSSHREALERFALSRVRDEVAAQDIVQEAFLRLIRESAAGRGPDNPGAWLFRVAANLIATRGRRTRTELGAMPRLLATETADSPEEGILARERAVGLSLGLASLSSVERTGLVLAAQGVPGRTIARAIGRSEVATRTLLCRARSRLRQHPAIAGLRG